MSRGAQGIFMDGPGSASKHTSQRFRDLIERLYGLARWGTHLGLGPMARVLTDLGHPELKFRTVHVAGSNGKGSTCAFLASILSQRKKVGLYTSPHLISLTERVQVVEGTRARSISEDALIAAVDEVERVAPGFADLSFFEVLTAAGMVALAKEGVEIAVIEAGLGARLDATRLVEAEVAVLTDISLEHTNILGETLEAIAREEAAVIRPQRPCVAADGPPPINAVIDQIATELAAPCLRIGRELAVRRKPNGKLTFELGDRVIDELELSLLGPHQGRNALLATKAALLLDPEVRDDEVRHGLRCAFWPGRVEILEPTQKRPRVLLDGAQNAHASAVLADALTDPALLAVSPRPFHFLFGVLSDKDARKMLDELLPLAEHFTITEPSSHRARPVGDLLALMSDSERERVSAIASPRDAFVHSAAQTARAGGTLIVCGSLYLVGEIRGLLLGE